jgi:hypothetical protein
MAGSNTSDKTHRSRRNTDGFKGQPKKRVRERQRAGRSGFHEAHFFLLGCLQSNIHFLKCVPFHGQLEPNSLDLEGFLSKSQSKISAPAIEPANAGQAI